MKKLLSLILSLMMLTPLALADGGTDVMDAFYALIGQPQTSAPTSSDTLAAVMANAYQTLPADSAALTAMADALPALNAITGKDLAAYASANAMNVGQVRNAWYRALSNVLRADMSVNAAATADKQNAQTLLALFLDQTSPAEDAARARIRQEMTPDAAAAIAREYGLPENFVAFLIMDDGWDDDRWDNDADWQVGTTWAAAGENSLKQGDRDSRTSTRVAELQERLIALGYLKGKADGIFGKRTEAALIQYQRANGLPVTGTFAEGDEILMRDAGVVARWDYDDSFDDTPDNTPDRTPDNTPDNTPDRTPDNTPDRTPDNTPDNTPDDTP